MPSPRWPRVVAEALAGVRRPLATVATPLHPGTPSALAWAWQCASMPTRSPEAAPHFLLASQHDAWRRTMSALTTYRGALLAEPVGSGKTWIALGVAAAEAVPALVIGPAILQSQWRSAATQAGVSLHLWSHERLSRGQLPPHSPSLVIIDEAHRLRDAAAIRTRTLAPWLRDRRVLLITATPIVNRLDDLITLLRLVLAEDALRLDGVSMLGHLTECPQPPLGLQRVMIRSAHDVARQASRTTFLAPSVIEESRGERAVGMVEQLTRRHRAGWSRLLAAVLLDAAASSDAAFRGALRRYRALLSQAREAGTSDRDLLRRFAGRAFEQTVLWEMVGATPSATTLAIDDLPMVDTVLNSLDPADASWVEDVRLLVADGVPTVCFTRHRPTAMLLRTALGEGTAWITGDAAGIGPHRLPREAILGAFGPRRALWSLRQRTPHVLVATDVAAEGLDLQSAGRVLHVDLPWTAMRVAQREGRLLRLGQEHAEVQIVVRSPTAALEAALARVQRVASKRRLSVRWLDAVVPHRIEVSAPLCPGAPWMVVSAAHNALPGEMVLLALTESGGNRHGTLALERTDGGGWRMRQEDAPLLMAGALVSHPTAAAEELDMIVESASRWALREILAPASWGAPRLVARIHRLARAAAWRRDAGALARLDRLLRWCTAPPTLGDRLCLERLAMAPDAELLQYDAPSVPPMSAVTVTTVGVVLFRSTPQPLR